jgi:hypothetical protein
LQAGRGTDLVRRIDRLRRHPAFEHPNAAFQDALARHGIEGSIRPADFEERSAGSF